MEEIRIDKDLVSYCGLYCGACRKFIRGKCFGCAANENAAWCGIRKCCIENECSSCADCRKFSDIMECKDFNNFFSKFFALVFGSDRKAGIDRIKEIGREKFAREMAEKGSQSIKRK